MVCNQAAPSHGTGTGTIIVAPRLRRRPRPWGRSRLNQAGSLEPGHDIRPVQPAQIPICSRAECSTCQFPHRRACAPTKRDQVQGPMEGPAWTQHTTPPRAPGLENAPSSRSAHWASSGAPALMAPSLTAGERAVCRRESGQTRQLAEGFPPPRATRTPRAVRGTPACPTCEPLHWMQCKLPNMAPRLGVERTQGCLPGCRHLPRRAAAFARTRGTPVHAPTRCRAEPQRATAPGGAGGV